MSNLEKYTLFSSLIVILLAAPAYAADVQKEPAEPLALRKIMQDMGQAMQVITGAIAREDWQQVAETAPLIADHPKPPLSERVRILAFAGTDIGRFKDFDSITHDTARQLAESASRGDGPAVIRRFADLQTSCLDCHQAFRKPLQAHFYGEAWQNQGTDGNARTP